MMSKESKRFLSKKSLLEAVLATGLTFLMTWLFFSVITFSIKPFNYVAKAIKSVYLTDIYYSGLAKNDIDSNIVLVNVENLDRAGIANTINQVAEFEPRVIALDILIDNHVELDGDSALQASLLAHKDIMVLASFVDSNSEKLDTNCKYFEELTYGHVNLWTNADKTEVIRTFPPTLGPNEYPINSFAAAIAQKFDAERFDSLMSRGQELEHINYVGDRYAFQNFTHSDFSEKNVSFSDIEGKIVMMGFIGGINKDEKDFDDKYFTPVNKTFVGRSRPDMFGVVIQANIVSMITSMSFIDHMAPWLVILLTILVVLLHVFFFVYFFVRQHMWYHLAAKLIQLVSIGLVLLLVFIGIKDYQCLFQIKYLVLSLILAVDVLYLYETLAKLAYKHFGWKSVFNPNH
jgi:CHASE2 domain-containing sensor protein